MYDSDICHRFNKLLVNQQSQMKFKCTYYQGVLCTCIQKSLMIRASEYYIWKGYAVRSWCL